MTKNLNNIPTSALKEFAKRNGIPCSGGPTQLRERINQSVAATVLEADAQIAPYLTTQRTQNYRFYLIEGVVQTVSEIENKIRQISKGDPFVGKLHPMLSDSPSVVQAQLLDVDTIAIDIAFRGDSRIVQNDWETIEVHPLIQAKVIYRPKEKLVEIRGRRRKLDVIEEWIRNTLGISAPVLKFTFDEQMKLKQTLSGKTYSIGKRPKAGKVGMVRLSSSDIATDVEEESVSLSIDEVLAKIGGSDRTSPTLVFWDKTKVRPNEREGSFYIHRHVSEDQLSEFRTALLAVKDGINVTPTHVAAPIQVPVKRVREISTETLGRKIAKVKWTTDEQRTNILRIISSLSIQQQKRILPGFLEFALYVSSEAASKLCNDLDKFGLFEAFEEAICPNCGAVVATREDWDGKCLECEREADSRQTAYRIKGFIKPAISPDDIFKANPIRLNYMHARLLKSRETSDNDEKKHALEDYMGALFEMIEGVKCVKQDARSASDEIDLVFQNAHTKHSLVSRMGTNFIAMCRNTADPVDSKEMGAFAAGLKARDCKYGVYISVNGFSGLKKAPPTTQDCKQVIRDARKEGVHILALDLSDITRIVEGKVSLPDLLWEKNNDAIVY